MSLAHHPVENSIKIDAADFLLYHLQRARAHSVRCAVGLGRRSLRPRAHAMPAQYLFVISLILLSSKVHTHTHIGFELHVMGHGKIP